MGGFLSSLLHVIYFPRDTRQLSADLNNLLLQRIGDRDIVEIEQMKIISSFNSDAPLLMKELFNQEVKDDSYDIS